MLSSSQVTIKSTLVVVGQNRTLIKAVATARSASSKSARVRFLSSSSTCSSSDDGIVQPQPQPQPQPPSITLYQYSICPFCNINKALLSYTDTPYQTTEVNPLTKAELKFSKDYKKVPILQIKTNMDMDMGTDMNMNDEDADDAGVRQTETININGSKEINHALLKHPFVMRQLQNKWNDKDGNTSDVTEKDTDTDAEPSYIQFFATDNAKRWNDFATDELAPVLYPNICRSFSESYHAFSYVNDIPQFSPIQKSLIRGIGSLAMYAAASRIKKKRNITDGQERMALLDVLMQWEEEGLANGEKKFGSGLDRPDLGDVAMFGVMHSVSGMSAHDDVIRNSRNGDNAGAGAGAAVVDWYKRMEKEVL